MLFYKVYDISLLPLKEYLTCNQDANEQLYLPENCLLGFFQKARVYASVDNLFTITGYTGYSPDVNSSSVYQRGFDEFIYPANRTFMFGVNLTF